MIVHVHSITTCIIVHVEMQTTCKHGDCMLNRINTTLPHTGMYGQQGEWKTQYRDSRPGSARPIISSGGAQREGGTVLSVARYQHCATITGQYPDHNLLHDLPLSNLHQQCRDDEMHMFRLGIMLHMFSGLCARCIRAVHPQEPRGDGIRPPGTPGVPGMKRVFERLGRRLRGAGPWLMSEYVSQSFVRAFSAFSADRAPHRGAYHWGLTAAESEELFMIVPFALPGLLREEMQSGGMGQRASGSSPCLDPMHDVVRVFSRFTSWYMVMQMKALKDDEVRSSLNLGCSCASLL